MKRERDCKERNRTPQNGKGKNDRANKNNHGEIEN